MSKLEELLQEQQRKEAEIKAETEQAILKAQEDQKRREAEIKKETEQAILKAQAEQQLKNIEIEEKKARKKAKKAAAEKEKLQKAIATGDFTELNIEEASKKQEEQAPFVVPVPVSTVDVDEISAAIEKQTGTDETPFVIPASDIDLDAISPEVEEATETEVVPADEKVTERLKSKRSGIVKGAIALAIVAALALGVFGFKKLRGLVNDLRAAITANTGALGDNTGALDDNTGAIGDNTDATNDNTDALIDNTDATRDNTDATRDNTDATRDNTDAINRNANGADRTTGGQHTGQGEPGHTGYTGHPGTGTPGTGTPGTGNWPPSNIVPPNPPTPPEGGEVVPPPPANNPATVNVGRDEAFINENTNESHVGPNGWGHGGIDGTHSAGENPNNVIVHHPNGDSTITFDSPPAASNPGNYYSSVTGSGMDSSLLQDAINEELGRSR